MRIGIDGYNLAMPHGTGVATYGMALARALRAMGHTVEGVFGVPVGSDPRLREIIFFSHFARDVKRKRRWRERLMAEYVRPWFGARAVDVPISGQVETGPFADRLPAFDRMTSSTDLFHIAHRHFGRTGRFLTLRIDDPPDIMHWTYPVPIRLAGAKNVYTLHDLVPLRLPYTTLDVKQNYHRMIARIVREADHICADSEASREDIIALFDAPPGRVTNTYLAAPLPEGVLAADPLDDAATIEGIFGLRHRGYFLYFGAIEPRKNIARLIEAYLSLSSETLLVLVGAKSWASEEDLRLLDNGGYGPMAKRIVRLSYLPRGLLLRLIRGARAVAFPSLYEGFGLPVLEAMQLGTPVLTSDRSSMAEVAGDAALLVDPYSMTAIADGLRRLDGDAALRDTLGAKGLERAEAFSEARFRERLAAIYAGIA